MDRGPWTVPDQGPRDVPDPYRVNPARHRGRDIGILHRFFELPRDRRDDDPAGPRRLEPDWTDRGQR